MGWAHDQTHCPAGHALKWPNGTRSYGTCGGCPHSSDGRGHFTVWCEACRVRYYPPDCPSHLQPDAGQPSRPPVTGPQ
jgi:hypothetical protein